MKSTKQSNGNLEDKLKRKPKRKAKVDDLLSSGSTLLNLSTTGSTSGCFEKGKYYLFVGDSTSGKTWLCLNALAEAANNEHFEGYRLIHDNVEDGALMDMEFYFGKKAAARIEPPAVDSEGQPQPSSNIEEFYDNVTDATAAGPCVYILDSMDALSSEAEIGKFEEQKKARRAGRQTTGSYGDGKAKKNSSSLRRVLTDLQKTGSILIIIAQTRDNIGFGFDPKTFGGGRALKFYATLLLWSSIKKRIKKTIAGKQETVGILSRVQIKKNRVNGRDRDIEVPIYLSYGVDDIGSCVDFLVERKHWKQTGNTIKAPEFDQSCTRAKLISYIEDNGKEAALRRLTGKVWRSIDKACEPNRKPRYE